MYIKNKAFDDCFSNHMLNQRTADINHACFSCTKRQPQLNALAALKPSPNPNAYVDGIRQSGLVEVQEPTTSIHYQDLSDWTLPLASVMLVSTTIVILLSACLSSFNATLQATPAIKYMMAA